MSKVTRIVHSVDLNIRKFQELQKQAELLGDLAKEIWQRFGSYERSGVSFREIRDDWLATRDFSPLPAKAWKELVRDLLDNIAMYEEACKVKIKDAIFLRTKDPAERKRLFQLLARGDWKSDPYLSRKMRQYKKHGKTSVKNQIVLESGVFSQFLGKNGNTYLKVPTFERGKRLVIPLNSNIKLKGQLRLILKEGVVYVHYCIERKKFAPCGTKTIGVDKGYSEAFVDSDGEIYGSDFGKLMTKGTQRRHVRGKARNRLYQIAKKKAKKFRNVNRYNLGRKKLDHYNKAQKDRIENIAFQAVHALVDKASTIIAEDLTRPILSNIKWKAYNRRMSAWAKGSLANALSSVCKARGSCLRVVNAAYTSQIDSKSGRLEGRRDGDKFYHANGEVSSSDTNAAVNILRRADDTEIGLYTPYREVKKILQYRSTVSGGVSSTKNDRPSRTPVASRKRTSTESELREQPISIDLDRCYRAANAIGLISLSI